MTRKSKRPPTPPGEILQEEFLDLLGLTQRAFAEHIGCEVKVINRLVNGRTRVTAGLAIRLAAALGTTPEFWLNAQQAVDLYEEYGSASTLPERLRGTALGSG